MSDFQAQLDATLQKVLDAEYTPEQRAEAAMFALDRAAMDHAGIQAIRQAPTSSLLILLVHHATKSTELDAIAAEIDRRIPVPDPRIGKLCRLSRGATVRVVGVEPGGALLVRRDGSPAADVDERADPELVVWDERTRPRTVPGYTRHDV